MGRTSRARRAVALALSSVALAAAAGPARAASAPTVRRDRVTWSTNRPDLFLSVRTSRRLVALTLDDGPDPRYTPRVLRALAASGARATFFQQGSHVRAHPALARRVVAAGHEVANHTYSHPEDLVLLNQAQVRREITRGVAAMRTARVAASPLFRPPRGRYDVDAARAVAATGHLAVGWDVCVEAKLRDRTTGAAVDAVMARVRPGSIVLAHDGGDHDRERTMEALPLLLRRLRAAGYRVVTVSELLREA